MKITDQYENPISNKKVYFTILPQTFLSVPPVGETRNAKIFKALNDCPMIATLDCPNALPNDTDPRNPIETTTTYYGVMTYAILGNTTDTKYAFKVSAKKDFFNDKGERVDTTADITDVKLASGSASPAEFDHYIGHADVTDFLKLFYVSRINEQGQIIDAGGTEQFFPFTVEMWYMKERENTTIFDSTPVYDGTAKFYVYQDQGTGTFWQQSVTNLGWKKNNKYMTSYKLGTEPEQNILYATGNATIDGKDLYARSDNVPIWTVTATADNAAVIINSDGYPSLDTVIGYTIMPDEYNPATIEVFFYENNQYMGLIPGNRDEVIVSQGFAKNRPCKIIFL